MFHCLKFLRLLRIGTHVKKSFEPDQQWPEAMALRPLDGFATAISTAFFRQGQMPLTTPHGRGSRGLTELVMSDLT